MQGEAKQRAPHFGEIARNKYRSPAAARFRLLGEAGRQTAERSMYGAEATSAGRGAARASTRRPASPSVRGVDLPPRRFSGRRWRCGRPDRSTPGSHFEGGRGCDALARLPRGRLASPLFREEVGKNQPRAISELDGGQHCWGINFVSEFCSFRILATN